MRRRIHRNFPFLVVTMALLLMFAPYGGAEQVVYHRVAPKISVPFDPNRVTVLHRSDEMFTVEYPHHRGYVAGPRVTPFGDKILFMPGLSTFSFASVYLQLEKTREMKIPGDVSGAPPEIKGVSGPYYAFDRQMRSIAFACDVKPGGPKQMAEREICVVRSEGTGLRRLTRLLLKEEGAYSAEEPAVSEDGSLVVYRRSYAGYLGIVRADGTGLRVLVRADGLSPVVLTRRGVLYMKGGQVWLVSLDGTDARQVTRERGEIGRKSLTADAEGRRIAYIVRTDVRGQVVKVLEAERGTPVMTLEGVVARGDRPLKLSGDGRRLLYVGQYRGKMGIYVFDLSTKRVFEVSAGVTPGEAADLNETGEVVVFTLGTGDVPLALAFLPDETPPSLWVDAPRPGSTVSGETVSVSFRYQDRAVVSGVDQEGVKVLINGRDVSDRVDRGVGRARGQLGKELLREGENVLQLSVRDRAGNEARQVVRFQFKPKR